MHELGKTMMGVVATMFLAAGTTEAAEGPHGAATMDTQMSALAKLVAKDVTAIPKGIDRVMWNFYIPEGNEMTEARVALGRKLYFDPALSRDGTVACATCHDVLRGFTDQRPVSEGIGDQLGRRNAPTTLNAALMQVQFLDGRAPTLEEQAKLPITNPIEMGQPDEKSVVAAVKKNAEYAPMFEAAYGRGVNFEDLARAIAAFERTLIFLDAPFDRFLAGDANAMSEAAQRGFVLYNGKARCATCHPINASNPVGADHRFHNIGVSARAQDFEKLAIEALALLAKDDGAEMIDRLALETDLSQLGRFLVTKDYADIGSFKSSQVRNVGITGPYMHDGTLTTLWDVMDHYNKGGEANPYLDGGIVPLALTEDEIDDVVAFLFALTDTRFAAANDKAFEEQKARAKTKRPFRETDLATRKKIPFADRIGLKE